MPNRIENENIFVVLRRKDAFQEKLAAFESQNTQMKCQGLNLIRNNLEGTNVVGDIMWPVILFLKLVGHSPLTYVTTTRPDETLQFTSGAIRHQNSGGIGAWVVKEYKVKWKSYFLIWTAFCGFSTLYISVQYLDTIVHPRPVGMMGAVGHALESRVKHGSTSQSVVTVGKGLRIFVTMIQLLELLFSWQGSSSLSKFLNSCRSIQKQFQLTFPHIPLINSRYKKLIKTRNWLLLTYVSIPTIIFVPFYVYVSLPRHDILLNFAMSFGLAFRLVPVSLLEDVKVFMTYGILAEAFNQIHEGIVQSLKWEKLTASKVKSWTRIVHSVRLHVEQAGQSQKNHQLFLVGGSVVMATGFIFMLLNIPWSTTGSWVTGIVGGAFVFYISGRLYLKILAANKITKEESLIAQELVRLNTRDMDVNAQLEIAFLHDMITKSPSIVSFGGYVSLNKQLLLGVASQVVTYLIVLMQFVSQ